MLTEKNQALVDEVLKMQKMKLKGIPKLDINSIEKLPLDVLHKHFDDYSKCENLWMPLKQENPIEYLKNVFAKLREFNEMIYPDDFYPYYEEEVFINRLLLGQTVEDMYSVYRIHTDADKCPRCGSSMFGMNYALSRRDGKTHICSVCGEREAIEDFTGRIDD